MGRNVLVIGGAGYVGSHVVLALLEAGHRVTVLDNLSTGKRENLFPGVSFFLGDILDERALDRAFLDSRPDAIIHLASLKAARESMEKPGPYATQNICGSIHIINKMVEHGVGFIVFSSSAAVYGEPEYRPIDEDHRLNPNNFYGFTKLEIERLLHWFSRIKGLRHASLRYFNAVGYDAQGRVNGLEENPKNLVPIAMEAALGSRSVVEVFGGDYDTKDGSAIRDYVHVSEIAAAHVLALDYLVSRNADLICNLGSGIGFTVLEVLCGVEAVTGRSVPFRMSGRKAGDAEHLVASYAKAERVLGWRPTTGDLAHMLQTAWDVYAKHDLAKDES